MVRLRALKIKDVPFMLEWMRDPDTQRFFQRDMSSITEDEAKQFCLSAGDVETPGDGESIHFAIADDADEYLGTISLKKISLENRNAEYAISLRKSAQGTGVAEKATRQLLKKAFEEYGLHRVYLNVLSDNIRAIRFYEKCGFALEGEFREHIFRGGEYCSLMWYAKIETVDKKRGEADSE